MAGTSLQPGFVELLMRLDIRDTVTIRRNKLKGTLTICVDKRDYPPKEICEDLTDLQLATARDPDNELARVFHHLISHIGK